MTDDWIAVNKPPGWLTIPGRGRPDVPILIEWVRRLDPGALIVHRLDIETSGAILFARNPESHRRANEAFSAHRVTKRYHCLASGRVLVPMMRIKQEIEGASASSQVEVLEKFASCFLAQVRPLTGRRHQIRIHLAHQGHPILGDAEYGGPRKLALSSGELVITRVALHASALELPDGPKVEAPWPEDFSGWVARLRSDSAGREGA